jgi:uncharacterized damage-inducible protein DinB
MMAIWTKDEIAAALRIVQTRVSNVIAAADYAAYMDDSAGGWSASGYLAHLVLSVKPTAKVYHLPPDKIAAMFGVAAQPERTYDEIVALYDSRLAGGLRAEMSPPVLPTSYRFPEGVTDVQAHLLQAWNDGNNRLIAGIEAMSDADLDRLVIPHPMGEVLTLREMLFFTIHHNTMHAGDIERVLRASV